MTGAAIVTGATGFAGSHLVDSLRGRVPLVGWFRPGGTPPESSAGVDWRGVDLLDASAVSQAIRDIRPAQIYHLAGSPSVGASWQHVVPQLKANVLATHHLLDAVRNAGLTCRVLIVSSAQIYQASDEPIDEGAPLLPSNPYGISKLAADELARRAAVEDNLDIVVARPFNHAGPRQRPDFVVSSFARQIALAETGKAPAVLRVGNLDARRDITDVRDVVQAYEQLMQSGARGRVYNICSGRAWRMSDLLAELMHLASAPVSTEIDEALLRPSDVPVLQGDATRIRLEVGWTPHIRVERTLRDTLDWWRKQLDETRG